MALTERGGVFRLSGISQVQLRVQEEAQNFEVFTSGWMDGMDSSYMNQVLGTDLAALAVLPSSDS
jgi:predicted ATP-grasp superfamily ATP-dependent carboligase